MVNQSMLIDSLIRRINKIFFLDKKLNLLQLSLPDQLLKHQKQRRQMLYHHYYRLTKKKNIFISQDTNK
jgi:hypothetical protein